MLTTTEAWGETVDGLLDQQPVLFRRGRFACVDTYQAPLADPVALHKYLYANANPVANMDPTGKFSTLELAVGCGIAGSLVGMVMGAYLGAQGPEGFWSWKTLEYGIIGGAVGFAAGFLIGGTIGVLVNGGLLVGPYASVLKISSKLVQQFASATFGTTLTVFSAAAAAGAAAEIAFPDRWHEWIEISALLALPADAVVLTIWNTVVTRVPGFAQESLAAVLGFNVGYFGAKGIGALPAKVQRALNAL